MRNPKDVLTKDGYEDLKMHHRLIEKAVFYFVNEADDLHIGDEQLDLLYKMQKLLESKLLLKGDGETYQ